jgi:hypothetical protein
MLAADRRRTMGRAGMLAASACALAALAYHPAVAVSAKAHAKPKGPSIYHSRDLWATINVCNPKDMRNTIGIRGSMPGDGSAKEKMYMRFKVQYLDTNSGRWLDVARNADSGYRFVGPARVQSLQAGRSFVFVPRPGAPPFQMRGEVGFQWRRGSAVLHSASLHTSAPHKSLQGADPPRYTAATCKLG